MEGVRCQFSQTGSGPPPSKVGCPSLWTMAFSNTVAREHCAHCLSLDHASKECQKAKEKRTKYSEATATKLPICRDWNNGKCSSAICEFRHICIECHGDHAESFCPRQQPKPYYKPFRPTQGYQSYRSPFRRGRGGGQR